jgi:L-malate glycosyltransferase
MTEKTDTPPMSFGNKWPQDFWDSSWSDRDYGIAPENDQMRAWMEERIAGSPPGSCFEVGCFPGAHLAFLGAAGYTLNGADLTPRTSPEMAQWLRKQGYKVGAIDKSDFLTYPTDLQHDLVYSNGFIEHFENWKEVLLKHAALVKPGGLLLIAVPNFRGRFQNWLHRLVDQENLDRHYLPSMDPTLWAKVLSDAGFTIEWQGYFAEFEFWVGVEKRSLPKKLLFWTIRALIPLMRAVLPKTGSESSSPYCGVAARKMTQRA